MQRAPFSVNNVLRTLKLNKIGSVLLPTEYTKYMIFKLPVYVS